jgi:phosphate transport system substrate-binding protein
MKSFHFILLFLIGILSARADTLRISGSNTFGEKLGPQLVSGFERKYPGTEVTLQRPGSAEGLAALMAGKVEVAPTSRPANAGELRAAKQAGVKLLPQNIGSYGVAVIVNAANPVKNLKPAQVRALFNGKTTNWSKVRGPEKPVNVYILDDKTGARAGFQDLAMRGDAYAASAKALPDYAAIEAAVAKDPEGIGYTDMGSLPDGVRALLINGQPANGAAIYEQVYPFASTLYLYALEGRETSAAKKFVRYVLSKEGQRIIQKAGFVPRLTAPTSTSRSIAP